MNEVDPELLGRLFEEHAPALELYARQWSDSPQDIVQEAFLKLVRQREVPQHVAPWLFRVVRNEAISAARKTRTQKKGMSHFGLRRRPAGFVRKTIGISTRSRSRRHCAVFSSTSAKSSWPISGGD